MHYLLFIGAFLFFAFIAPLKVVIATAVLLLIILTIVRFTATAVTGMAASYGEAFKAVGLAFFFLAIWLFTLMSFSKGTGTAQITGVVGLVGFAGIFVSYVLGFKLGLGGSLGASSVIAGVSTAVSAAFLFVVRGLA